MGIKDDKWKEFPGACVECGAIQPLNSSAVCQECYEANNDNAWEQDDRASKYYFKEFLTGLVAKKICNYIVNQGSDDEHHYPPPHNMGYFKEGDKWIAYDNTSKECFVEEFETEQEARDWLNLDDEEKDNPRPKIMKVWIEADRQMAHWQGDHRHPNRQHILNNLGTHDEAQGLFVLNHLLDRGATLLGTHHATTGGVCVGVFALVDVSTVKEQPPSEKKYIEIEVYKGDVVMVDNLPKGYDYTVWDSSEDYEEE